MIEREMEELLAGYPDEFFPRQSFVLKGRQQSFAGVGRFDLLFEDQFHTTILMELKARPAKYEDATQLAKYKDELEHRGDEKVLMWLVAPNIPKSVCDFLERIGIQYSEIHFVEFRRAALRHGIPLPSESEIAAIAPKIAPARCQRFQQRKVEQHQSRDGAQSHCTGPVAVGSVGTRLDSAKPRRVRPSKIRCFGRWLPAKRAEWEERPLGS